MFVEAAAVEDGAEDRLDERLLAVYAARLDSLRYESLGVVEALVLSPSMDEHVPVSSLRVLPGEGPEGQYPGKQWWQGRRVPGRQISTVNAEVLEVLDVAYTVPGDNMVIRGIDLGTFEPGDVLRVGDALLTATATPHRPCAKLAQRTSLTKMKAISGRRYRGTLFDALRSGTVYVGDAVERLLIPRP